MAAATTWVSTSSTFVDPAASASTSGTNDSAVSATVVRIHAVRGWRANRRSAVAMASPTTAKITVMTAKPDAGIGAPDMSVLMPTAWPAVATSAVAAAATTVATAPVSSSERIAGAVAGVRVAGTVVADTGTSGGRGVRPGCRSPTKATNGPAPVRHVRGNF